VGVGAFGQLTYWGRTDNTKLGDCSPTCPDSAVLHVRRLYWGADAALGVGLASLALSAYFFASSSGSGGAASAKPGDDELSLLLAPTASGATASLSGSF
jgi:hypothetical protein